MESDFVLNIAVCDDEAFAREELSERISRYFGGKTVRTKISGFESGAALAESTFIGFDAVFLDIGMEGADGIETARLLRGRSYEGILIFVTVLGERVYDSFEVSAYDYLVKPVSDEKLERTLGRLLASAADKNAGIVVQSSGESRLIPFSEICCCEVIDKKVYLRLASGETEVFRGGLESLADKLDGRFFRCHRSYIVNLGLVESFGGGTVRMKGGASAPLSRLRKKAFSEAAAEYFSRR